MTRIVFVLLLAAAWLDAHAQSSLPPCPESNKAIWTNCFGFYEYANGIRYVGEFRRGKRNGQGTNTWTDGSKYVGEFQNDKFHGQGTLYNANGTVFSSGMWRNDQLLQSFAIDTARLPVNASSGVEVEDPPIREPNKKTSVGIVNDCLAKGLKPGTSQFSRCVSGQ